MKVSSRGRLGYLGSFSCGKHVLGQRFSALDDLPDPANRIGEELEVSLVRGDGPLPVPLIDIGAVIVIEEIVFADSLHVGADALPDLAIKGLESHALPLGGGLHDLRVDGLVQTQPAGEFHRRSRAVAVQHVVDAALAVHDQGHLDHHQVQFPAQVLLDVVLDAEQGLHGFTGREQRRIVTRQDLRHFLVRADARTGQVRFLVRHDGISRMRVSERSVK